MCDERATAEWVAGINKALQEGESIEIIVDIETKVTDKGEPYLLCTHLHGNQFICRSCKPFADAGFDVSQWGYEEPHTLNYVRVIVRNNEVVRVPEGQQFPHFWVRIVKVLSIVDEWIPTVYFYDEKGNKYHDLKARSAPLFARAGYTTDWANTFGEYPISALVKISNGTPIQVYRGRE